MRQANKGFTMTKRERAASLREQGVSWAEIARRLRIKQTTAMTYAWKVANADRAAEHSRNWKVRQLLGGPLTTTPAINAWWTARGY